MSTKHHMSDRPSDERSMREEEINRLLDCPPDQSSSLAQIPDVCDWSTGAPAGLFLGTIRRAS